MFDRPADVRSPDEAGSRAPEPSSRFDPQDCLSALASADTSTCTVAEVERHMSGVNQLRAWLDAVEAGLVTRAVHLERSGRGAGPTATLVSDGLTGSRSARTARARAAVTEAVPELGRALGDATIGADHVDAVARVAAGLGDDDRSRLLAHSTELTEAATRLPADAFSTWVRKLGRLIQRDQGLSRFEAQRRARRLRWWTNTSTGMVVLSGELDPESGARLATAVAEEVDRLAAQGATRSEATQADALIELLTRGRSRGPADVLNELVLLVDAQTLDSGLHDASVCETSSGDPLPVTSLRRLACSSEVLAVVRDSNDMVLHAARSIRTANRAQRRALRAMHHSCAFDRCDRPFDWCQIHHVIPWDQGGPTDLDNLVPLCSEHHHALHEGGWQMQLRPDRTATWIRPDSSIHSSSPTPTGTSLPPTRRKPGDQHARINLPSESPAREAVRAT